MRLKCVACGAEFTVSVHHGPDDRRVDWTDGPHHCFVCGGEAEMEEDGDDRGEDGGAT